MTHMVSAQNEHSVIKSKFQKNSKKFKLSNSSSNSHVTFWKNVEDEQISLMNEFFNEEMPKGTLELMFSMNECFV